MVTSLIHRCVPCEDSRQRTLLSMTPKLHNILIYLHQFLTALPFLSSTLLFTTHFSFFLDLSALIMLIYASLVNMAILGTKLRDKAKDGDSLLASVVPAAFIAVAGSYSQQLHTNAHELVC